MDKNLTKIFDFLHEVENLKSTLRVPKTRTGRQESSAEHSWRTSLLVFIVAEELQLDINICHATKMAIVHDLAEYATGDYSSYQVSIGNPSREEKEKQEKAAMERLRKILSGKIGGEVFDLWHEFEKQETREAKYVKALDRIETLEQFIEMGSNNFKEGIDYLAMYADEQVKNFPELKEMLLIAKEKLKKEYEKSGLPWKDEYNIKF